MIDCETLTDYLAKYLACAAHQDACPNGLQVSGKKQIKRLATAVTAADEVIIKAIQADVDLLLVHHGYFWKGEPPQITGLKRQRLARLLQHEMNLLAYHLPLDTHLEVGNNACLGRELGFESIATTEAAGVPHLFWTGRLPVPQSPKVFADFLGSRLRRSPVAIVVSDKPITKVGWCSGAAQDLIETAAALGMDAYISGEISERTYYQAKELGIHYFGCGHHATERYGIQALGAHLAERFDLAHVFIDSDNPV